MKQRFGLVRRPWGVFYLKDKISGSQISLKTSDKCEAQRLLVARNEAEIQPAMNLQLARVYASAFSFTRFAVGASQSLVTSIATKATRWKGKDQSLLTSTATEVSKQSLRMRRPRVGLTEVKGGKGGICETEHGPSKTKGTPHSKQDGGRAALTAARCYSESRYLDCYAMQAQWAIASNEGSWILPPVYVSHEFNSKVHWLRIHQHEHT